MVVDTDEPELAERVCRVAERSAAPLFECNLDVPSGLRISLVPDLPAGCLGVFHCGTSRIEVLHPVALASELSDEGTFATIPTEVLFDSLITHEMAHAAYDDRNCPFATCPVASEYIAFVMQVRSLPEADRARFEAASQTEPKEAHTYLSSIMLAMSPKRFASAAWAHFQQREVPCDYIGAIASGKVMLDQGRP